MTAVLVLVDFQRDYLNRPGLTPRPEVLLESAEQLLRDWRSAKMPVAHVHTLVRADGEDRMPHWKRDGTWRCLEGSHGAETPNALRPIGVEKIFAKQYYSAFGNEAFGSFLNSIHARTLVIAGLYLHSCIRSTALDAYERRFKIVIAEEAVGWIDTAHAEATRSFLDGRSVEFQQSQELSFIVKPVSSALMSDVPSNAVPVGFARGQWIARSDQRVVERRNPSNWSETFDDVPIARHRDVHKLACAASDAQPDWGRELPQSRRAVLENWASELERRSQAIALLMAREVGKPVRDGAEELRRAVDYIRSCGRLCGELAEQLLDGPSAVTVRHHPRGAVGIITPWNNPVAIPTAKIGAALACGNAVLWKPAMEAPRTAMAVIDTLMNAGLPDGLIGLAFGDAGTSRAIIDHPSVSAVSLTGSIAAGRAAAVRCANLGKPFQGELGGNNAAIVLRDADVASLSHEMALASFSFSGQRCTSIRRWIVERAVLGEFARSFTEATTALRMGDPCNPRTDIGPLISKVHRERILREAQQAVGGGAEMICGGDVPDEFAHGCWLRPIVLSGADPGASIEQHESFGPIALLLPADDFDDAVRIANAVEHGLMAGLYTSSQEHQHRFSQAVEAGILNMHPGPLPLHADAPFGGWKASGYGPPEHGVWDVQFYTRPQAVYGPSDE